MPKFIGIIGNANSGKSTVIQSLTGCQNRGFRGAVVDQSTKRTIEVICSSPQENPFQGANTAQQLANLQIHLNNASAPNSNGIVCALQPTNPHVRLSMINIIKEAINYSFSIHLFVLDPGYNGAPGNFDVIEADLYVQTGVRCIQLNGKRFAHVNSTIVNSLTHIAI